MSLDLSLPLKAIQHPLHDSIRELREGYQSLSDCVEQAMADCEQRGAELADCRRQLAEARRSLIEQEKNLSERTKAEADAARRAMVLKKQLEAAHTELSQANEKLLHVQAEELQSRQRLEIQVEYNQQLQTQIERLKSDDEQTRGELAQLRSQFGPLTEATVEAAKLRGEMAAAQLQLATLHEQAAARPDHAQLGEQLSAALAERQQLEVELDLLRRRGAELTDALNEQKRVMVEERERWSEELRQLRRSVDRQSELFVLRSSTGNGVQPAAPTASEARPASPPKNDQVMDTVLQQFEMLQKNKIRKMANTAR